MVDATGGEEHGSIGSATATIQDFLLIGRKRGRAPICTSRRGPPMMRHGRALALPSAALDHDTKHLLQPHHRIQRTLREDLELDFSFGIRVLSRFRATVLLRGAVARRSGDPYTAARSPSRQPRRGRADEIRSASSCDRSDVGRKSTSLAAMLDKINRERKETSSPSRPYRVHHRTRRLVQPAEVYSDTKASATLKAKVPASLSRRRLIV